MELSVSVLSPQRVIFQGSAKSLILPGESGVFEVLPFHKRLLSRLLSGVVFIDQKHFPIKRGAVQVNQNRVIIIVDEP